MRIPSQFNEDSLYRRGRRDQESAQTYRRLIRLVIGLALVVVVMKQAARPEIYQTFFGSQAAATEDRSARNPQAISAVQLAAVSIDPQDRQVAHRLVEQLSPAEQRQWAVTLSRWQAGRTFDGVPASINSMTTWLADAPEISPATRDAWESMLRAVAMSADVTQPEDQGDLAVDSDSGPALAPKPAEHNRSQVAAMLATLDDAAANRVVDGSVWRSGDFDAFYRYLDQAETLSSVDVASVGVLPLLQQPDVFRNQLVRAVGGVARAERIDARENPYGITHYWQLWIRPSDGADRPIVAIVQSVSPEVAGVGASGVVQDGPRVTVVGRFLKRLAYQSSMGADLAPVLVGRVVVAPQTVAAAPAADPPPGGQRFGIVVAAVAFGLALALITMWRTAVMAKRARQLRTAHRDGPEDFLKHLEGSTPADVGNREVAGG